MRRPRFRFSLRTLLFTMAIMAVAMYVLSIPTVRARRLVALVESGQPSVAETMLPESLGIYDNYRQVLRSAKEARLEPISLGQIVRGERRVVVGKGWGGGDAELIITYRSVHPGRNGFNVW